MNWLLLIIGLVGTPVFVRKLITGLQTGVINGPPIVNRRDNPLVFKMAVFLEALFIFISSWFVYQGILGLIE